MEYEEHEKRAWSVDFSRTEPTMLVSGSDDGKVLGCTITQKYFGIARSPVHYDLGISFS